MRDEIPRSLLFLENGRDVAVFGLEKGSVLVWFVFPTHFHN